MSLLRSWGWALLYLLRPMKMQSAPRLQGPLGQWKSSFVNFTATTEGKEVRLIKHQAYKPRSWAKPQNFKHSGELLFCRAAWILALPSPTQLFAPTLKQPHLFHTLGISWCRFCRLIILGICIHFSDLYFWSTAAVSFLVCFSTARNGTNVLFLQLMSHLLWLWA